MTNYLEDLLLNHVLNGVTYNPPTDLEIGLFTADPTDSGDLTNEVSAADYLRQSVDFTTATSGYCANASAIDFPTATSNWGTVTHVGIFDENNKLLFVGELDTAETISSGNTFRFPAGDLSVELD